MVPGDPVRPRRSIPTVRTFYAQRCRNVKGLHMPKRSKKRGGKGAIRRARLQIEELEAREVPSVSAPGGIDASPFAQDHIVVRWLDGPGVNTPLSTGVQALGNGTYDVNL